MDVVHERCCGLDIHKQSVVACLLTPEGRETRRFGTMTRDLIGLADWLEEHGITHVAMESTGVYWKPIYNLFEGHDFTLLVVNARHLKAVPGRKTDVKDAEWIAQLLRHGLLQASHIPSRADREVRELVRYRKTLIRERSAEVNRVQKVLEGANIKLASVASGCPLGGMLGKSGRAMLDHAPPGARLVFSCGWHITRDGQDVYPWKIRAIVKVLGPLARLARYADLDDQVEACRRVFASDTRWTVVRGSDLEEGESQGLPVWSRHVGDPMLASNRTRRVDFALFMVAALEDDALIHEAPAIVGCRTPSALAHAAAIEGSPSPGPSTYWSASSAASPSLVAPPVTAP
jgi:transposase